MSELGRLAQSRSVAACLWCAVCALLTTCATGLEPPALTAMAVLPNAGKFVFGSGELGCRVPQTPDACQKDTLFDPQEPSAVVAVKPFAIDVHEVTNEQYRFCVAMDKCSLPAGDNGPAGIADYYTNSKYDKFPVVMVRWTQAVQYCEFASKRLPTEFEWEYVAGGPAQTLTEKRIYPWAVPGFQPPLKKCDKDANIARCNSGNLKTRPVKGSLDDIVDVGGTKVYDLGGNVSEFTSSDFVDKVTCDATQPYECEACGKCLLNKSKTECENDCKPCKCGNDSTESKKPNCYAPCENPICPKRLTTAVPLDGSYTSKNFQQKRIVRGGSYFNHNGADSVMDCDGRSDTRKQTTSPIGDPQYHYGFRCAKSL